MSDTERLLVGEDSEKGQEMPTVAAAHDPSLSHASAKSAQYPTASDRRTTSSNTTRSEYNPDTHASTYTNVSYAGNTIQPSVVYYNTARAPVTPKPEDYLELSVFILICCSFLPGLVALAFSFQSKRAWAAGDCAAARENARYSLYANCFGIVVGISSMALIVAFLGMKFTT